MRVNKVRKETKLSSDTERKLLQAAVELFSRNGFKGTSIRDIAREMNMSIAAIYYYYGTKGGVLFAIEKATIEPMLEQLREVMKLDLPAIERFRLLLRTHLFYVGTHRKESRIFFLSEDKFPADKKGMNQKFQTEVFEMYRTLINVVLTERDKKGHPAIAALTTFGIINWFLRWYRPNGELSMSEVIDYLIEIAFQGIVGPTNGKLTCPPLDTSKDPL